MAYISSSKGISLFERSRLCNHEAAGITWCRNSYSSWQGWPQFWKSGYLSSRVIVTKANIRSSIEVVSDTKNFEFNDFYSFYENPNIWAGEFSGTLFGQEQCRCSCISVIKSIKISVRAFAPSAQNSLTHVTTRSITNAYIKRNLTRNLHLRVGW